MSNKKEDLNLFKSLIQHLDIKTLEKLRSIISKRITSIKNIESRELLLLNNGLSKTKILKEKNVFLKMISEDWSSLFSGDNINKNHYVYIHIDPVHLNKVNFKDKSDNIFLSFPTPIYVGKGTGERMYNFIRGRQHSDTLRGFLSGGFTKDEICYKIQDGLTEIEALEFESKLILFFGCTGSGIFKNKRSLFGGRPRLLNKRYEPYPLYWDAYDFCYRNSGMGKLTN